jgi:Rrf2 family protein
MYALRAVLELSTRPPGCPVSSSKLAAQGHMPTRFLPQVLGSLVRRGILISATGVSGGYCLARDPSRIRLLDIIEVFENPLLVEPPGVQELSPAVRERLIVVMRKSNDAAREELSQCSVADLELRSYLWPTSPKEQAKHNRDEPRVH